MGLIRKVFGKRCSRCGALVEDCPGHKTPPQSGVKPATRDQRGRMRQPRVPTKDTGKKFGR